MAGWHITGNMDIYRDDMAKTSGGVRTLKAGSKNYNARRKEFWALMGSGKYSDGYFSDMGGGYYLVEKSEQSRNEVEHEAAQILADNGYKVILIDEAGSNITVDGTIFSFTYEQRTPYHNTPKENVPEGKGGTPSNIRTALSHARNKGADYAVIYMKHDKHTRKSVESGIRAYEALETTTHRFKKILIITKDGRIYRHVHNK